MKTVCVTGASGFIGRHTSRLYASKGWHVTGIGHGMWDRFEWQHWGISDWHLADINLDSMLTCAGRPDVIIHCAGSGSVGSSMANPFQEFQRTVTTTAAVLEFIRIHSPHTSFVFPSSAGVYGIAKKLPISESAPLQPISIYGVHKKMAEDMCRSYASNLNISVAIVRLFSIFGDTLRKQLLWDACTKLSNNESGFFGSGKERRDWLHIDDAATLLLVAADNASPGSPIVNGGSGVGVTTEAVLTELFSCYGSQDSPRFSGASRPGDPVDYIADISRAGRWGWQPSINWQEGIRKYVEWYKGGIH